MLYKSTRNNENLVTSSSAILQGLAEDGGLFVPTSLPEYELDWNILKNYSYQEMAYFVLRPYLADFSEAQLKDCIQKAYDDKFDDPAIAPLVEVNGHHHLELFHGATIAFKDLALSILPHLMKTASTIQKNDRDIVILTATSGDTGKAAMAGFADVENTKIIVFYPKGGVSSIQEQQMVTQTGDNTYAIAVNGNFDKAQSKVKELFSDTQLRAELADANQQFSSANSMNIGRLLPQIVYYFYAYAQMVRKEAICPGDLIDFSVPTGNFGNILSGFYAKQTGLPIDKLLCASNDNRVLYDFFHSGTYDANREFQLTISPSMDILISSNFERLVYHAVNENTEHLTNFMDDLKTKSAYAVPEKYQSNFSPFLAEFATEAETKEEIQAVYTATQYVMDPHTAVASKAVRKAMKKGLFHHPVVIVSTASPYKFPEAVLSALGKDTSTYSDADLLEQLHTVSGTPFPPAIEGLLEAKVRHNTVIEIDEMKELIQKVTTRTV